MIHLGNTRSCHERDYLLQTPDTFVRAPLPGMVNVTAIVHAAPALGAQFTQYTVEFSAGGQYTLGSLQAFVYVRSGAVTVRHGGAEFTLAADGFAYLPPDSGAQLSTSADAVAVVIEKPFAGGAVQPAAFHGNERAIAGGPLEGDDTLNVRKLFPEDTTYDFAVNTMTYQPGATLPMVEIHVMEHGLLMLDGEGIYRLGDKWYPVAAGDFIWMAPYCPQWFGALGKKPARYLIYKDWNRHPCR